MGTVNPSQSSPGDTIEAADVNTPVNQLAAVINGSIETVNLADSAVTTAKLADGSVTAAKITNTAITLGYTAKTSNYTLSSSQTTPTQVTDLTVTVTIPTGSRKIKITAYSGAVQPAAGVAVLSIWDGTVNSGTQLTSANCSTTNMAVSAVAVVTPASGSKTYNVGVSNSGLNNVVVGASATQPSFILVEAI